MKKAFAWLSFRKKAIVAAVVAFGGAYSLALDDNVVTTHEWIAIAVATIVGYTGTYAVRNSETDGTL